MDYLSFEIKEIDENNYDNYMIKLDELLDRLCLNEKNDKELLNAIEVVSDKILEYDEKVYSNKIITSP